MKELIGNLNIFNKQFRNYSSFYVTNDCEEILNRLGNLGSIITFEDFRLCNYYGNIIINHRHNHNNIILRSGCEKMSLAIRNNIDYVFISKNTKNLEYVFEKYIKDYEIGISYVLFLEYLNKYNHLLVDHFEKKLYRYLTKEQAARIIQKGCHNWLYKPNCKDNTIGIVPRLGFKGNF